MAACSSLAMMPDVTGCSPLLLDVLVLVAALIGCDLAPWLSLIGERQVKIARGVGHRAHLCAFYPESGSIVRRGQGDWFP
jgi:hypothetical protein